MPDDDEAPSQKKQRDKKEPKKSRREAYVKDGIECSMPDCDAEYLLEHLFDIGPVQNTGMGLAPISHMELRAWQDNTGICLQSWEAEFLRRLSSEYVRAATDAKRPDCPAPWIEAPYAKPPPNLVAKRMREEMRRKAAL